MPTDIDSLIEQYKYAKLQLEREIECSDDGSEASIVHYDSILSRLFDEIMSLDLAPEYRLNRIKFVSQILSEYYISNEPYALDLANFIQMDAKKLHEELVLK